MNPEIGVLSLYGRRGLPSRSGRRQGGSGGARTPPPGASRRSAYARISRGRRAPAGRARRQETTRICIFLHFLQYTMVLRKMVEETRKFVTFMPRAAGRTSTPFPRRRRGLDGPRLSLLSAFPTLGGRHGSAAGIHRPGGKILRQCAGFQNKPGRNLEYLPVNRQMIMEQRDIPVRNRRLFTPSGTGARLRSRRGYDESNRYCTPY